MSNKDIALDYLKYFCDGDIDSIDSLLSDDLDFNGPFFTFSSADDYIESLKESPPEKCGYKVISITESHDSVALFYEYQKPEKTLLIAQLFQFVDGKIGKILIVFDGREFTK